MLNKEKLNYYAEKLMFRMSDEEYDTLLNEFKFIENQMELIEKINGINNVKPMTFPYDIYNVNFREDRWIHTINTEDALKNAKNIKNNQVEVPKVVE